MTLHPIAAESSDAPAITLPTEVREVVELFAGGVLDGLSFPEVDAHTFDTLIQDVQAHTENVDEVRRMLSEAREELARAEAELARRAEKALAYAKVFAAADPELTAQLEELALAKRLAKKTRTRRKRRKPAPKPTADDQTAELPLVAVG